MSSNRRCGTPYWGECPGTAWKFQRAAGTNVPAKRATSEWNSAWWRREPFITAWHPPHTIRSPCLLSASIGAQSRLREGELAGAADLPLGIHGAVAAGPSEQSVLHGPRDDQAVLVLPYDVGIAVVVEVLRAGDAVEIRDLRK